MKVEPADRRIFFIEKQGGKYTLVHVFEKGSVMDAETQAWIMRRTLSRETEIEESIIATQDVSISSQRGKVKIEGGEQRVREATKVAEFIVSDSAKGSA